MVKLFENKLIEEIKNYVHCDTCSLHNKCNGDICICNIKLCLDIIKNQPKVNEWISVEDRLPTKSNSYLVTKMCKDDDENLYEVCSEIFWTRDNKWDCERDEYCEWKVIAWQELPSKYEG